MSLIFVHLRWNDPGPDRYEAIIRAIPQAPDLPAGCLSRHLRRQGGALLATEAYDTVESGGRMDHLVTAMRNAGVEDVPQSAMFSVPAMYATAYRQGLGTAAAKATPTIPDQRRAPAQERLRDGTDAISTAGRE